MYVWIEWLKEQCGKWSATGDDVSLNQDSKPASSEEPERTERSDPKAKHTSSGDAALAKSMVSKIVSGEPFMDRKSTFQAHVAPVTSLAEVNAVMDILLENNKIRNATHNIMAYRICLPDRNTVMQDFDDDGETSAGGRLLHLLQIADVKNAVVVVSRWFGGILLGPARFTHINNVGRSLLEQLGFIAHTKETTGSKHKGKK